MSEEKKTLSDYLKTPPAKRGKNTQLISAQLRGQHVQDTTTSYGQKYTLRTLEPWEEVWAAGIVPAETLFQSGEGIPKAYLAVALVAVNGSPVEAEFAIPDELDPQARDVLTSRPDVLRDWRRREVYNWISHDLQAEVIEELWQFYLSLVMRRKSAMESLRPLSTRTPSGESSATSSPEPVTSPASAA